jgi:hypothetical protein
VLRRIPLPSLLLALTPLAVATQLVAAQAAPATSDSVPAWHFGWGGGLHFFGPTNASIALGAGFKRDGVEPEDRSRFLFAFAEPGIGAQRLSAGYAESVGSFAGGWSARASWLLLSGEAHHRRYGGIELQVIPLLCLGGRLGAFRPLDRNLSGSGTLWVADFSLCL